MARYDVVDSLVGKVDAVVHLAAIVSPYLSVKKLQTVNEVNVSGTLNVLRSREEEDRPNRFRFFILSVRKSNDTTYFGIKSFGAIR